MNLAFLIDSVAITKAVVAGETSLGGSESACLGLARGLKARGHDVHIFATHLADDAQGVDAAGVVWHRAEEFASVNQWVEWDVAVALRQFQWFGGAPVQARLRLLWNQDMLMPGVGAQVMSIAWALDHLVYVSEYHRAQWESQQKELAPLGWVTKNGFDTAMVPTFAAKDPHRIIHISRPERGLAPILAMWPALRKQKPNAELHLCRYESMYDSEGSNVRALCQSFDAEVERVNAEVGGITYLGSLNKQQLYQAIADAAVMWYPGIADFAETSCIAAIEAQACGTPFVGSYKGALPETVPSGVLLTGNALTDAEYHRDSIAAVLHLMDGCARQSFEYRKLQQAGREHVTAYTYDVIAAEWDTQINAWFKDRYETHKVRVLRQLLHEDDHTAAKLVAEEITREASDEAFLEAQAAIAFCDRVIAGLEQGPEDYAAHAIQDPLKEVEHSGRFQAVAPLFAKCTRVLDVACGNGAGAIAIALANPAVIVVGLDYSAGNIALATDAAARAGVSDRCTFLRLTVFDLAEQRMGDEWREFVETYTGSLFDGLFVGEFIEHVADCSLLVDALEALCDEGATVIYTCPVGPFAELLAKGAFLQRGHVHCFRHDDVKAVWGAKENAGADFMAVGVTPRGNPVGHWLIHYTVKAGRKAGLRNLAERAQRTRPQQKLTVGLITYNAENDLARCLASVWNLADELIIGDTGSTDHTKAIAADYKATILDLAPIRDQPEGFAGARNAVLREATGDWFLWIDADEQLLEGHLLRRYLDGALFNGFVLNQTHLYMDGAPTFDIPVRLFRTGVGITFYGCVHEQPQQGDPNADIFPSLQPFDVRLAHTGYLTNSIRETKRRERNFPLILLDQKVFPTRILGKLILMRETVLQADMHQADAGGLTERAAKGYEYAIQIWDIAFADPAHKLHQLARPWYEAALRGLGHGFEMEIALGGKVGGLNGSHASTRRIWARGFAEVERAVTWQLSQMKARMEPRPVQTDPFVLKSQPVEVSA